MYFSACQRVEEQERENNSMGKAVKLVKGKVGKPKVKKIQLEETLPSPFGRRVEPQITLAMKADASKKMTKRKKVRETHFRLAFLFCSLNEMRAVHCVIVCNSLNLNNLN